jgi:hypothetical protein
LLAFLGATALGSTSVMSNAGESVGFVADNVPLNALALVFSFAVFFAVIRFARLNVSLRTIKWALFAFTAVSGFIWVAGAGAVPSADSGYVLNAARMMSENDYAAMGEATTYAGSYLDYFGCFPYQFGIVFFYEALLRLVPFSALAPAPFIQLLNVLFLAGAYFFIVDIARRLSGGERAAKITAGLLLLCPQPLIFCTFTYGTVPGLFFGVLAIWAGLKFFDGGKIRHAALSAAFSALAATVKQNYLIFTVALCIAAAFGMIAQKNAAKAVICGVYALVSLALAFALVKAVIFSYELRSGETFGEGVPMSAWLAMGLGAKRDSDMAPGWFNYANIEIYVQAERNGARAAKLAREEIKARADYFIANPGEGSEFFRKKIASQWNETSYQSIWNNQVRSAASDRRGVAAWVCGAGAGATKAYMDFAAQFVFAAAAAGAANFALRGGEGGVARAALFVIVTGGFLYHLLFEGKSQYILPYFILLIPVAGGGIDALYGKLFPGKERA